METLSVTVETTQQTNMLKEWLESIRFVRKVERDHFPVFSKKNLMERAEISNCNLEKGEHILQKELEQLSTNW